jgi:hypothetical protein
VNDGIPVPEGLITMALVTDEDPPCLAVEFPELGIAAFPYPDEIRTLAAALLEGAGLLEAEILRRQAGMN